MQHESVRTPLRNLSTNRILAAGLVVLQGCGAAAIIAQERPATEVLLREVVKQQLENLEARYHYRYQEEDITEDLDKEGNPKRFDVKLTQWQHTDFDSYVKYLAINGGYYSLSVLAEQQAKIDQEMAAVQKKSREDRELLRAKMAEERRKEQDFIRSLPDAATFQYLGEQTINGHPSWMFSFSPRPGFRPASRETGFLKTLTGKIWVTHNEHQLIRLMGTLGEDVDFGAGLFGSVKKGSTITLEQLPVAGGYWMPSFTEMDFRAKVFVKGENQIQISRYHHYEQVSDPRKKIEVESLP